MRRWDETVGRSAYARRWGKTAVQAGCERGWVEMAGRKDETGGSGRLERGDSRLRW